MNDLISRRALCDYALNQKDKSVTPNDIMRFPSAQPIDVQEAYYRGKIDGVKECMARLRKVVNEEFVNG
jgi:hypothetical protein